MAATSRRKASAPAEPSVPDTPVDTGAVASDTRERLIETAARHFAEYGFEGASLRAIQREIGVNPASVHYHFGSKKAVYEAIMENYFARIQQERERRFEAIDPALRGRARLLALLEAYVAPHLAVVADEHGDAYGRLMARGVIETSRAGPDLIAALQPLRERFLAEFGRLFPEASRVQIARALSFAITLMVTIPFDRAFVAMTGRPARQRTATGWTEAVVSFSAAGFTAIGGELVDG